MEQTKKNNWMFKFLNVVEVVGNKLPDPATLFASFALLIILLSWLCSTLGVTAVNPATGETIHTVNLLSKHGVQLIFSKLVTNFTGFAPLGMVMVAILGIGAAEHSGMLKALLKSVVKSAPPQMVTVVIVLAGIMSNMASDIGYVLIVPLGAMIFLSLGRHPIAGLAAAFAGVSGGFAANLLLGTTDVMLSGISQEAARILPQYAEYEITPLCNYYFMFCSTFLLTFLGTIITEKIIEPKLGKYTGDEKIDEKDDLNTLTKEEKKGLWYALWAFIGCCIFISALIVPENGLLRGENGAVLRSPFMHSIIAFIFIVGMVTGIAYGIGAGTVKSDKDVVKFMAKALNSIAGFMVLVFFAAQFVAYFNWTNLGLIFAVNGASFIASLDLGAIPLLCMMVFFTAFINMFMGSASAKWTIMAPVFIPMFMLMGYTPEVTQLAYRIGDSSTNIVSPMMSFFALILAFFSKYDKNAGIGTMMSIMLPYSIIFLIAWTLFFIMWLWLGLPIGPGSTLMLPS